MPKQRDERISFDQMMNEGLKQFDDVRRSIDWSSHSDCKKLIRNIATVIKCTPETAQASMCLCLAWCNILKYFLS